MKIFLHFFLIILLSGCCLCRPGGKNIWVTAYYAGWMQGNANDGQLPAQAIDYSAITHIIHFGLIPKPDGSFDTAGNGITAANIRPLVIKAHAAQCKVLIAVGGQNSASNFLKATAPGVRNTFISNLISFLARNRYDGIDVDWEILRKEDGGQFGSFVRALRRALDEIHPRPLLTAAAANNPEIYAGLKGEFDQINLMTYDMAGPWPGWPTWHNSPVYDGGATFPFPRNSKPLPSINGVVNDFLSAGVPAGKMGIGIDFYGYVWQDAARAPGHASDGTPSVQANVPYSQIMQQYRPAATYAWDSLAQASYLSGESKDGKHLFISYDDERSAGAKVGFVREKGLGGVMIWELGGGYLPASFSKRDRLLQAIKHSVH